MHDPAIIEQHRPLIRKIAAESMVLLKNVSAQLPLPQGCELALFGYGAYRLIKGGAGSADIFSGSTVEIVDALLDAEKSGRLALDKTLLEKYRNDENFQPDEMDVAAAAADNRIALWIISRNSGEGLDRTDTDGDFRLSADELRLLELLKKYFGSKVVVVLNTCGVTAVRMLKESSAVSAVLYAGLPGGDAGNAIADVLLGRVNPSGRLVDTWAEKYSDYPSSASFRSSAFRVDYEEGVFVGYRWFESAAEEQAKVVYCFGHGLSYTEFKHDVVGFEVCGNVVKASCRITNVGTYAGQESIGLWSSFKSPSLLDRPAVELRDFAKTPLLQSQESCDLCLSVNIDELAVFDDGNFLDSFGSWVLEKGKYEFFLGGSVRELILAGDCNIHENTVISTPGCKLTNGMRRKLAPGGKILERNNFIAEQPDADHDNMTVESSFIDVLGEQRKIDEAQFEKSGEKHLNLTDVGKNGITLDDFVDQFTPRELLSLCQAQLPTFPHGTAGIGNLRKYLVPNPQTADGPAGVRLAVPTSCLPSPLLVACSWDKDLIFQLGAIMGREAAENDIDIMLAPGMNIHRDPLCGRNFEYYSEDPLISGMTAAFMVQGIQSCGTSATLKHFAVNNKEEYRFFCSSMVSERALREIYLKNFEFAVKIGKPHCIMSAYNYLNNFKVSTFRNLLTGVLRDEWGFDGLVMTDWRNDSHLWQELLAGNDIKMPFGYPEELEMALGKLGTLLPLETVKCSAKRVLALVMKTRKFRELYMGRVFELTTDKTLTIQPDEISEISCNITRLDICNDQYSRLCHSRLCKDQRNNDIFIKYYIRSQAGRYKFSVRTGTIYSTTELELVIDGSSCGCLKVNPTGGMYNFQTLDGWEFELTEGEHTFQLYTRDSTDKNSANIGAIFINHSK